jgi:hypothetical protein
MKKSWLTVESLMAAYLLLCHDVFAAFSLVAARCEITLRLRHGTQTNNTAASKTCIELGELRTWPANHQRNAVQLA